MSTLRNPPKSASRRRREVTIVRIEILDQSQGISAVRRSLDMPAEIELESDEGLAAVLRLVGAMRTPCRASRILREVTSLLSPLLDPMPPSEHLEALLDSLISYGDLAAITRASDGSTEMLYRVQLSYLVRSLGDALLIGLDQPGQHGLPPNLQKTVRLHGHARVLPLNDGAEQELRTAGLLEISENQWLDIPRIETSTEILAKALQELRLTPRESDVSGITLIDPTKPVRYYAGRKRPAGESDFGFFVARRPREYGADAWCFVEMVDGQVIHLLDLSGQGKTRGCDRAWLLQAAIDRERSIPQVLGVSRDASDKVVLSVFSPIPGWLQRRWETMSTPTKLRGALISYAFDQEDVEEEIEFARKAFYLEPVEEDMK